LFSKVENILKGSLDSIPSPSPSVKIQIMGGKVCLRCKGKTLLGLVNKRFVFKSRKDFKRYPGFNSITFTFSENSNYGRESLLEV
jgi:hypothetical protein